MALFLLLAALPACDDKKPESGSGENAPQTPVPQAPATPTPTQTLPAGTPQPTPSGSATPPSGAPRVTPSPGSASSPSPTPSNTLGLLNDAGGVLGEPDVLLFTGGGLTISEQTGSAPEGSKFFRSNGGPGGFFGVTFDRNNAGKSRDLSGFSNGGLHFFVRTARHLEPNEKLSINVSDANGVTKKVLLSPSVGFSYRKANTWQEISIPLTSYAGAAFSKITVPFAMANDSPPGTPAIAVDVDAVEWRKTFTAISVPPDVFPPSNTWNLYNDAGGILGDPDVLLFTGGGSITLNERSGGGTEGSKYLAFTNVDPTSFWGLTYAKRDSNKTIDRSDFRSGRLRFSLRLGRALAAGETIVIDVKDNVTGEPFLTLGTSHGFSRTSTAWQSISIPLSSWSSVNFSRIQVPFAMSFDQFESQINFDVDDLRWDK